MNFDLSQVLGLGLEAQVLGLGLEAQVLGLGLETQVLGLEPQVLVNITGLSLPPGNKHFRDGSTRKHRCISLHYNLSLLKLNLCIDLRRNK